MTCHEYLANPEVFPGQRPKVINLSRSFANQSRIDDLMPWQFRPTDALADVA